MRKLIKNGQIVDDSWVFVAKTDDANCSLPEGDLIVPLNVWTAQKDSLDQRAQIGVWIDSDEEIETLAEDLSRLSLVAVNFPSFRDGRGFSTARLLRDRYGFQGEVRAVGDVLQDQLFFMQRCGFDAYALREDRCPEKALASLNVFSVSYQGASDDPRPLFRRRSKPQNLAPGV